MADQVLFLRAVYISCSILFASCQYQTPYSSSNVQEDMSKSNKQSADHSKSNTSTNSVIDIKNERTNFPVSRNKRDANSDHNKQFYNKDGNRALNSAFRYNDQIMRNLLQSQSPKPLSYARSNFFLNLLRPLDRRTTRYSSWDDHSVMHFGKRYVPLEESNQKDSKALQELEHTSVNLQETPKEQKDKKNIKTRSYPWSEHDVMHFGKRTDEINFENHDKSEVHPSNATEYDKDADRINEYRTIYFNENERSEPLNSIEDYGVEPGDNVGEPGDNFEKKSQNPWGDHSTMHFGKRSDGDPWHSMMSFGKKSEVPWNEHNTMHFGKREDDPWHSMMSFGKKSENPWDHSTMHFGKRPDSDPWHSMMSFGKRSENPFEDHNLMHFGKKSDDPWHKTMSFGKKSENPWGDHSTMHFGKRDDNDPWHSMMSFGKRADNDPWHSMMSFGKRTENEPWHSMMSFGKRAEGDPWHSMMSFGKRNNDDPWHSVMSFGKRNNDDPWHSVMSFGKKSEYLPEHVPNNGRTYLEEETGNISEQPQSQNIIPNNSGVKQNQKRSISSEDSRNEFDTEKRSNEFENHNTMHFGKKSNPWESHNTLHFGKKSNPWDSHNTMHFGKKSDLWESHNVMHFGKKSDPWENHSTLHFGKKSDPWENHNTLHFGKKADPWESHNTMHFGKKSDPWESHNTMHFGKKSDPWENHNTLHFGKKSDPWESHNTMHFGKKSDPWENHNTLHFGKKSDPWESHNTMHFGKKSDPWENHNTLHFGKKSDPWESHNTLHFGKKSDLSGENARKSESSDHEQLYDPAGYFDKRSSESKAAELYDSKEMTKDNKTNKFPSGITNDVGQVGKDLSQIVVGVKDKLKIMKRSTNKDIQDSGLLKENKHQQQLEDSSARFIKRTLKSIDLKESETKENIYTQNKYQKLNDKSFNNRTKNIKPDTKSQTILSLSSSDNTKTIDKNRTKKGYILKKGTSFQINKRSVETRPMHNEVNDNKEQNYITKFQTLEAEDTDEEQPSEIVLHFGKRSIEFNEGINQDTEQLSKKAKNSWENHSTMHFGKKSYPWESHNVMHFGKKSDPWESHNTMHFGKKSDPWESHNVMHFGKRSHPWEAHNTLHFGKKLDPWESHNVMHFGKKSYPWESHNVMHFGKKSDPWESHNTMHFGKKSDPWESHNTMHFGKKSDPWEYHNTMHFGKKSDPWESHNTMHFGKKSDPWENHSTLHFGKKSDPWDSHNTLHFGKKSDPWENHSTMHFGKKSDPWESHNTLHFGKRNVLDEIDNNITIVNSQIEDELTDKEIAKKEITDLLLLLQSINYLNEHNLSDYENGLEFRERLRNFLSQLLTLYDEGLLDRDINIELLTRYLKSLLMKTNNLPEQNEVQNENERQLINILSNIYDPENGYSRPDEETDILSAVNQLLQNIVDSEEDENVREQEDPSGSNANEASLDGFNQQSDDQKSAFILGPPWLNGNSVPNTFFKMKRKLPVKPINKRYWAPFQGPKSIVYPHAWFASQIRRSVLPKSLDNTRIFETRMAEKKEDPVNSFMHFGRR